MVICLPKLDLLMIIYNSAQLAILLESESELSELMNTDGSVETEE